MVFFDCIALISHIVHQLHIYSACLSVPELSTQGVPQSDSLVSKIEGSVDEMEELRIGDAADSMRSLPNTHEKADTIMAYSTVSGTATQLVTLSK